MCIGVPGTAWVSVFNALWSVLWVSSDPEVEHRDPFATVICNRIGNEHDVLGSDVSDVNDARVCAIARTSTTCQLIWRAVGTRRALVLFSEGAEDAAITAPRVETPSPEWERPSSVRPWSDTLYAMQACSNRLSTLASLKSENRVFVPCGF